MARRSLQFSKKRSSKATISKKRKADKELRQTWNTKRVRQSSFQEDEEEIGDFIVVDTGTLYEPEQTKRQLTSDEEESRIGTPPTSHTPLPSIELIEEDIEDEIVAKPIPETASSVSNEAHGPIEDLLVHPLPTEASEGSRSRKQSLELPDSHRPSGSKDDPVILSPLTSTEEEAPQSPIGRTLTDNLDSSVTCVLKTVSDSDAQAPEVLEETESGYSSMRPPSVPQQVSTLADPIVQPAISTIADISTVGAPKDNRSTSIEISAPRKLGDAPLGVLVTRGDQCPSKFVVSGNASHSQVAQPVSTQTDSQIQRGVSWFETVTVTKSVDDKTPQAPSLHNSQSAELESNSDYGLTLSQHKYQEYLQSLNALANARDEQTIPARGDKANEEGITSLPLSPPSRGVLGEQSSMKEKTEKWIPHSERPSHQIPISKQLPHPISDAITSPESPTFSGPLLLGSTTGQLEYSWSTELNCSGDNMRSSLPNTTTLGTKTEAAPVISNLPPQTLIFTAENQAQSTLTTAEVQQLIQKFVKDSMVILPQQQTPRVYPAGVIVWQSLQRFHKWYLKEDKLDTLLLPRARSHSITTLRFELLDVHWQAERIFYLPRQATWYEFRDLKQCIWDLFWASAHLREGENTQPFRISITPAPGMIDGAKLGRLIAAYSPTASKPTPIAPYQPSSISNLDKNVPNLRALKPNTADQPHRSPGARPPTLMLESPQLTLEVEGPKTPQRLLEFLQKSGNTPGNSQPASLHSSPTRPQSHGSSTGPIELLHPPLMMPESNMTAAFQPRRAPSNNAEPRVTLPPLETIRPAQVSDCGPQIRSVFQNNNSSKATHLPSPRPSPVITDTYQSESLRGRLSAADNNYAANTARPMFSIPHQKTAAAPPTVQPTTQATRVPNAAQPSAPNNRVPNTAQPAPNVIIAPRPPQAQPKATQPKPTAAISQSSRDPREVKRFRDAAEKMLRNRVPSVLLEASETTGGRKRTFPEISGVIVDKNSEMGLVSITEHGNPTQQVNTGQDVFFEQYTELKLKEGQTCVIHGSSTVLYYRTSSSPLKSKRERRPLPSGAPGGRVVGDGEGYGNGYTDGVAPGMRLPPVAEEIREGTARVEIQIRLQKDAAGHFSASHPFAILQSMDLQNFFEWAAHETGRDGALRPEKLRFVLKDAMPVARTLEVYSGWGVFDEKMEGEWRRVRGEIVRGCERAKAFLPDLREFGVLVVDPGWMENMGAS